VVGISFHEHPFGVSHFVLIANHHDAREAIRQCLSSSPDPELSYHLTDFRFVGTIESQRADFLDELEMHVSRIQEGLLIGNEYPVADHVRRRRSKEDADGAAPGP